MSTKTNIEWTSATWNPTVGCTKISEGCKHCYAEVMHRRLTAMGTTDKYARPFTDVQPWPDALDIPLHWREPRQIFVDSMSDLFHDNIPADYVAEVFNIMEQAHWHTFQVLTKRAERLVELAPDLKWPPNVWMGVTVESALHVHRARALAKVPAAVRFLSLEPLLGPIPVLPLKKIDWVIVGGESGVRARPMATEWAQQVRDQCTAKGVAFFLKQLGGRRSKRGGTEAILDGRQWKEYPTLPTTVSTRSSRGDRYRRAEPLDQQRLQAPELRVRAPREADRFSQRSEVRG